MSRSMIETKQERLAREECKRDGHSLDKSASPLLNGHKGRYLMYCRHCGEPGAVDFTVSWQDRGKTWEPT